MWKNLELKSPAQHQWWVHQRLWTGQQMTARQETTRQVTAQQMMAQHMTGRQVTGQQDTNQLFWMDQMKLPTQHTSSQQWTAQHSSLTTRQLWMAQHAISFWCWTAQQPMEPQQGIHHRVDGMPPSWRVLAVRFSRQCQHLSTRLRWSILCPCELCCSDGWTVPDAQARPAAQTTVSIPKDDTPPRRSDTPSRTPERQPRMPVRRARTPVRRARGLNDTRESSRSCSPVTRSSYRIG